jgi:hypothetical protein
MPRSRLITRSAWPSHQFTNLCLAQALVLGEESECSYRQRQTIRLGCHRRDGAISVSRSRLPDDVVGREGLGAADVPVRREQGERVAGDPHGHLIFAGEVGSWQVSPGWYSPDSILLRRMRASLAYWGESSASMSWSIGRSEMSAMTGHASRASTAKTAFPRFLGTSPSEQRVPRRSAALGPARCRAAYRAWYGLAGRSPTR